MVRFHCLHIALGGPEFEGTAPAPILPDANTNVGLCRHFRQQLLEFPLHFVGCVRVEGYPLIRMQWVALGKTAGLVLLRSGLPDLDVFSLLLNGVETGEEMALIRRHAPPLWRCWQAVSDAPRPLAAHGYFRVSRMLDRAVSTTLAVFANCYFAQFGTSGA